MLGLIRAGGVQGRATQRLKLCANKSTSRANYIPALQTTLKLAASAAGSFMVFVFVPPAARHIDTQTVSPLSRETTARICPFVGLIALGVAMDWICPGLGLSL